MADKPTYGELEQRIRELESEADKRKQIEREALMLKTAVEQIPVGIALADEDLNLYFCNPAGLGLRGGNEGKLVRIPKDAFDNWQVLMLNGEPYETDNLPLVRAISKGLTVKEEFIVRHQDGSDHICDAIASPIYENEKIIGGMVIFPDITERIEIGKALKESEEKLKEYSLELEREVEERTKELRGAQDQLIRKEKLSVLGQLAGGVGHELRNPLGVISNAVYYLKMVLPETDETVKEYLETISSEVNRSTVIVSDLLDLSRSRPAESEQIDVSELVNQTLDRYSPPGEIEVAIEIPSELPSLFVDPLQIGQVFNNLIANSCQAMPDGGKLTIKAKAIEEKVAVFFIDTGSGISKEYMEEIFEPLFTTKARGIGLGLAVSKNLIEANDGSIQVESEEDKGSMFTVILPIKEDNS